MPINKWHVKLPQHVFYNNLTHHGQRGCNLFMYYVWSTTCCGWVTEFTEQWEARETRVGSSWRNVGSCDAFHMVGNLNGDERRKHPRSSRAPAAEDEILPQNWWGRQETFSSASAAWRGIQFLWSVKQMNGWTAGTVISEWEYKTSDLTFTSLSWCEALMKLQQTIPSFSLLTQAYSSRRDAAPSIQWHSGTLPSLAIEIPAVF